jgi:hypothetical protein
MIRIRTLVRTKRRQVGSVARKSFSEVLKEIFRKYYFFSRVEGVSCSMSHFLRGFGPGRYQPRVHVRVRHRGVFIVPVPFGTVFSLLVYHMDASRFGVFVQVGVNNIVCVFG